MKTQVPYIFLVAAYNDKHVSNFMPKDASKVLHIEHLKGSSRDMRN